MLFSLDSYKLKIHTLFLKQITAVDDCGAGFTSSAEISVTVTDVTDDPPYFLLSVYKFSIKENSAWLHSVGNVTALDNDTTGSIIIYDFVEMSNVFHIDPLKGKQTMLKSTWNGVSTASFLLINFQINNWGSFKKKRLYR